MGVGLLAGGTPAWANSSATLNPNQTGMTADQFDTQCGDYGGGPLAGQDVWVFVLPNQDRDFVSLTLNFTDTNNQPQVVNIPGDPDTGIDNGPGTSKAWAVLPAGWTLVGGTAVVTGDQAANIQFNVTHTCPAQGTPSPSPSASESESPSPSPSVSPSESESPSESPSAPVPSESTTPPSTTSAPKPSGGPETGGGGSVTPMSSYFLGGGALLAAIAGIGFLVMARQRRDLA
ncbi:MAG: hypothetical protein HOV79_31630 [Hamadaea sp.]|nr:hypothetical protein [Hamadaea sp.]